MHQNKLWIGFLLFLTLALLWFTYGSITKISDYYSYDEEITASNAVWQVVELTSDQYLLKGEFRFTFDNKNYQKEIYIKKILYNNPWIAEQMQKQRASKPTKLWISKKNPYHFTVEKEFPFKEVISTVILWILWLYFIWIGFYVASQYEAVKR